MDSNTAMVFVIGAAGYKLLDQIVPFFFRKLTKDDYVTAKACGDCKSERNIVLDKLAAEISTIKALLLVIAIKNGIPAEQLAGLTK